MSPPPGLNPNIRLVDPQANQSPAPDDDVQVEVSDDEGEDIPRYDAKGGVIEIEHPDGSITISLDGRPIDQGDEDETPAGWFDNLVHKVDDTELSRISEELLRGIQSDIDSRKEWVEARTMGLALLGLKLEVPGLQGASDGAPVEGMSKVRHPLLLEAVLRFQANAGGELLPSDGPVKIRDDSSHVTVQDDQIANALEKDLNSYLTTTATEYYPDTDRLLFMLGFGGSAFKKVYFCPLRNRPVSESVDANDLIVDNNATDLRNARRITHRLMMRPSTVKRLQILGVYEDVDLSTPMQPALNSLKLAEKSQQGVSPNVDNPGDRDREIYECLCELDIQGFEHKIKGKESGLEIPYRVTIDVTSRKVLSIVRNYDIDTKDMPEARSVFVKYSFVPGIGFYDIGLLHILGNTTNAITAAWRELLDMGMYSNFPGFLFSDVGGRQNTNLFRVPPGGGAQVKTGGMPISQAIMPLPYTAQGMPALMSLVGDMAQTGMRIGGTSEMQVGEGRADAPVGTTLALIEQASKVLNAVHKRLHAAQSEEFRLLLDVFREHPDSFLRTVGRSSESGRSSVKWDEATFKKALENYELTPRADPNTASHQQRMAKVQMLVEAAKGAPQLFNVPAVQLVALQAAGWTNPEQFINQHPQPDSKTIEAQTDAQNDQTKAQAAMLTAHARMIDAQKPDAEKGQQQIDTPADMMQARAKLMDAHSRQMDAHTKATGVIVEHHDDALQDRAREADRVSREKMAAVGILKDLILHPEAAEPAGRELGPLERKAGLEPKS